MPAEPIIIRVADIVSAFLQGHHYDGLYCEDCACSLKDLMHCQEADIGNCKPGIRVNVTDPENGLTPGLWWTIGERK